MSRIKEEFLNNFQQRFEGTELDALRIKWEEEEMQWYFENQERPFVMVWDKEDEDSSITEQGI